MTEIDRQSHVKQRSVVMKYDIAVFIGRFQLMHNGHKHIIEEALKQAKHVIVIIGSARRPRDIINPFTFEERKQMIMDTFSEYTDRILIKPSEDIEYNDTLWIESVQHTVINAIKEINTEDSTNRPKQHIALIGHEKDNTSYYLKMFPTWGEIKVDNFQNLSSTPLRNKYFSNIGDLWVVNADGHRGGDKEIEHILPTSVRNFLVEFINTQEYKYIRDEYQAVCDIKNKWRVSTADGRVFPPYPISFNTVDSVVIQSGCILMVKRKHYPGKGLWALPGGYLDVENETLEQSMLRELKEETNIKVPVPVLKGSIVISKTFDAVRRSSRGRIITTVFLIKLRDEPNFPKTKTKNAEVFGGDDAEEAQWIPLAELNPEVIFEDHYSIISYFKAFI